MVKRDYVVRFPEPAASPEILRKVLVYSSMPLSINGVPGKFVRATEQGGVYEFPEFVVNK